MTDLPRAAVIVVNYASHGLLAQNLVTTTTEADGLDVIVVDNFSTHDERRSIRALTDARSWTLVAPVDNMGFGAGANLGAARAIELGCDAFVFLNPDVEVTSAVVTALVDRVRTDPNVMVSPRVDHPDGTIWFAGAQVDLRRGLTSSTVDLEQRGKGRFVSGACFAVHRSMWERLAGYDPAYFLYWEDVDLSQRCLAQGGELLVDHALHAVHHVGGTQGAIGGKSALYSYYNCRNRLLFGVRHLGRRDRLRWLLWSPRYVLRVVRRSPKSYLLRHPSVMGRACTGTVAGAFHVAASIVGRR